MYHNAEYQALLKLVYRYRGLQKTGLPAAYLKTVELKKRY